mgnify:CR=1 FL=1
MSGIIAQNTLDNSGLIKAPAGGGAWNFISKVTASASADISFTSGIDSTYKEYLITINNMHPASTGKMNVFFRDGGSAFDATVTSTNFSAYNAEDASATSLYMETDMDVAQGTTVPFIRNPGADSTDSSAAVIMYLFNPSSTTFIKHFLITDSYVYGDSYGAFSDRKGGYINTTTAIDGVKFQMASGNIDSGDFCLYGLTT